MLALLLGALLAFSQVGAETTVDTGATAPESGSAASAAPAARQASKVAIITIEGEIDKWTYYSVERRIKRAVEGGAEALVFELDTPGGEVFSVIDICRAIKNAPVQNTVAWVNARAYSGGAIIAIACREIVVSEAATMGDALPISPLFMAMGGLPDSERQKILSPLLVEVVDSARRHGHDEKLVQAFVTLGVELWMVQNTETGDVLFVDETEYRTIMGEEPPRGTPRVVSGPKSVSGKGASSSPSSVGEAEFEEPPPQAPAVEGDLRFTPASPRLGEQLVSDVSKNMTYPSTRPTLTRADRGKYRLVEYTLDGGAPLTLTTPDLLRYGFAARVVKNDQELAAFFGAQELVRLDRTWSEALAKFMSSLPVKGVLIVVFLLALFMEMASPGIGVAGGIAGAALLGLIAPGILVGAASWWGLAAIGAGVLLVAMEIFVLPGFGIFGIAGVVTLFAGLVGVVAGDGSLFGGGTSTRDEFLFSIATVLLAVVTAMIGGYFIVKHYGSIPIFNRLILMDEPREGGGMLAAMGGKTDEGPVRVGDVGMTTTSLRPAGSAEFNDRLVDVVSEFGFVEQGRKVRVTEVTKYRVAVEPMESTGDDSSPGEAVT
ncbi:MAG: hypothetical protein VYC34_06290 [Planctomycetota bacterium]|nr:hypothetical protein [Planctomycetota bacterium]